ncbi:hypothetical protein L1049_010705 [Liquidambar formosana]|uniref:Uncharacterized protein n=1 Tax=Liquidambar formosana TaxID=63359 RepID=A0AAP0N813_LIQFO
MDSLVVIERLDSLWFCSNIFSSATPPLASDGDGNVTENHLKETTRSEPSKPITPILENQQNQSPSAEIMRVETEKVEVVEIPKPPEKDLRRRRRKSQRSIKPAGLYERGRILGELDLGHEVKWGYGHLGFHVKNVCGSWMVEETCGYQRLSSQHHAKMPPLNDGMAMKEHLRSWAYAVASTVR